MLGQASFVPSDALFWLAAVIAVASLGLSKAGFVGFGLIATPLLALTVPPLQATAILLPIMLVQDYVSGWIYRSDWERSVLVITLSGALIGIGFAWVVGAYVSDAWLRIAVGILALGALAQGVRGQGRARKREASLPSGLILGATSGFAGTLANAGGPPFLAYVLPQQLPKMTFVGTLAIYFATLNTLKVMPIFALGQLTAGALTTSLVLMPLAVAATLFGIRLVRATSPQGFQRVARWMVPMISFALIWQGIHALVSR